MLNQRHPCKLLLLALVLAALAGPSLAAQARKRAAPPPTTLAQRIESILARCKAGRGLWGVVVARASDGKILYTRNPDHLFLPASTMKLFTTAAALEELGPDFVFRTTVESDAAPDAQGLVPNLILVGGGDPNLSGRVLPLNLKSEWREPADAVFRQLAAQVAARGVREVVGNLVLDDRHFVHEPSSRGWTVEDLQWGYGAPVTALAFNDNALRLCIQPGAAPGEPAGVWLEPIGDYYQIRNRVQTVDARGRKRVYVERAPGSNQLDVWGQIPVGAETIEDWVSIDDPLRLIGDRFSRALREAGIVLRGEVEVRRLTRLEAATATEPFPSPPARNVLAEHISRPLREELRVINKLSQNLHAEMLLRTLGKELKHFGSRPAGLEALEEFAAQAGIAPEEMAFADGSGLSRQGLVTPRATLKLLLHMAGSPHFEVFFDSLPVAGVDGTLAERFRHTPAAGHITAKTGTIEHVNALAGYMDPPGGERLAFCILGNSHALQSGGVGVVDRIALAIFDRFGVRKPGKRARLRPRASVSGWSEPMRAFTPGA